MPVIAKQGEERKELVDAVDDIDDIDENANERDLEFRQLYETQIEWRITPPGLGRRCCPVKQEN